MSAVLQKIDDMNKWVGKAVSWFILMMSFIIFYEVISRYFFNYPTTWANELSTMLFGGFVVLGGGYTLLVGGHVNMDLIYTHFSPRVKACVDVATFWLFVLFAWALLWRGAESAWWSLEAWEHSGSLWNPPVFFIKLVLPVGAFMLLMQGIAKFARDLVILIKGSPE